MKVLKIFGHWRWFVLHLAIPVLLAKWRYWRSLRRVRVKVATGERLRVVFVVGQTSKWKCQSVYDRMRDSPRYEPIVALTICDVDMGLTAQQREDELIRNEKFFSDRGMSTVRCFSCETNKNESILKLNPDLVFYSQPWSVDLCQYPDQTAKRALTFYVPYYVPTFESIVFSCDSPFLRSMFCYVALNASVTRAYRHKFCSLLTCRYEPLGHPALDVFQMQDDCDSAGPEYVIYAPHWSFDHPGNINSENLSTFLLVGMKMLVFAQSHSEIKWVFKPHPTLRQSLLNSGVWSVEEINAYYGAWEELGVACYDGSYPSYFKNSRALITDCGSFLPEYGCTGKPVIHLISPTRKIYREGGGADAFDSYYQAHDCDELDEFLQMVIVDGRDPKKEERMKTISASGLLGNDASLNIQNYLSKLLGVSGGKASF